MSGQGPIKLHEAIDSQIAQQNITAAVGEFQNVFGQTLNRGEADLVVVEHILKVLHNLLLQRKRRDRRQKPFRGETFEIRHDFINGSFSPPRGLLISMNLWKLQTELRKWSIKTQKMMEFTEILFWEERNVFVWGEHSGWVANA